MKLFKTTLAAAITFAVSATSYASELETAPAKPELRNTTIMVGMTGVSSKDDKTAKGDGFALGVRKEANKVVSGSFRYSRNSIKAAGANVEIGTLGLYPEIGYRFDINESFSIKPYAIVGLEYNIMGISDYWGTYSYNSASFAAGLGIRADINNRLSISLDVKESDLEIHDDYYVNSTVASLLVGFKF